MLAPDAVFIKNKARHFSRLNAVYTKLMLLICFRSSFSGRRRPAGLIAGRMTSSRRRRPGQFVDGIPEAGARSARCSRG
jgi:hypothetical protein